MPEIKEKLPIAGLTIDGYHEQSAVTITASINLMEPHYDRESQATMSSHKTIRLQQVCKSKEASPLFSGLVRRRSAASVTPAAARHRPDSRPSSASSPSRPARANLSGRTHRRFRRRRCTPCRSRTGRSEIEVSRNERANLYTPKATYATRKLMKSSTSETRRILKFV